MKNVFVCRNQQCPWSPDSLHGLPIFSFDSPQFEKCALDLFGAVNAKS